jgi:phenylalanyl-tRNA synthetase alpha chain
MKMYKQPIGKSELKEYLAIPDLTNEPKLSESPHAVRILYEQIIAKLKAKYPSSKIIIVKEDPMVSEQDCYDNLLVPKDNLSRSSTYTHYVDNKHCLQTHTTAQIPGVLRKLKADYENWDDVLILVPGLAYRRDVYDKTHLGVLHQLDIWRIVKNDKIGKMLKSDLLSLVDAIQDAAAPGWKLRIEDNPHPYTNEGIEVNAQKDGRDIEILECGLLGDEIIKLNGLDPEKVSGLASGLGLDRLVMTLKDIPDIRYLRSTNPRIAAQMQDLERYSEVSLQPAISRDMSYSVHENQVEEDINQNIATAIGKWLPALESVEVLNETKYSDLPEIAKLKLGIKPNQKNILVRITLRDLNRSITNEEANQIYKKIYQQVNEGEGGYLD